MSRSIAVLAALLLTAALGGCSSVPPQAAGANTSPTPTTTPDGFAARSGWLVQASNTFLTGSARLCGDDPVILDRSLEEAGIFVEVNGGPLDGTLDEPYEVDDGILLDFHLGKYDMYWVDGTARDGTVYEFRGTFTIVDDNGTPVSGAGSGSGKISHPSGDSETRDDTITISFSPIPEPDWCPYTPLD